MESTQEKRQQELWPRRLFFALALLYIVPFWIVHYLPTVDGPCHVYNAWILRHYGHVPLFQRYFEINAAPYPNWTGHGVMALLMFAVPPLVAEKLLASGYALALLAGIWYLAGAVRPGGNRWLALLAFPFVFNFLFQFGFYNFSLSLALFPFVLGFWWRHRERPGDLRYAVGTNLLLWLCYFSHILSFGLALLAIAVLWLATLRRDNWRRHLLHIPVLLPQLLLPVWYFTREGGSTLASPWPFRRLLRYFVEIGSIPAFGAPQELLAQLLALTVLVLLVLTLRREGLRRPLGGERAFLLLAAVFTLLYFVSPEGMSGGTMLKNRLCLYPYLILIPWLAPGFGVRARQLGAAVLAVVALLNLGYVIHWYHVLSGDMDSYLAGLGPVEPDTRVLPLLFTHQSHGARLFVLGHAMSYKALERDLVDWDNYEAASTHFPTRFREPWPPILEIEARPGTLRVKEWRRRADYVYTWQMPASHPFAERLKRLYEPVSRTHGGVLWKQRLRE